MCGLTESSEYGVVAMEIKEEHLQRVFDEIEERAIESGKKGIEYDITVSTAWSMRTKLLVILRSKSEEDLALVKMVAKDFMEILEGNDGDIFYFRYKCGHGIRFGMIYSVAGSVETYTEWKNDIEGICIECWIRKKGRQEKMGQGQDKKI